MLPLSLMFRRRTVMHDATNAGANSGMRSDLGLSPNTLMILLCIAGLGCCVAMSMPQVHIVAYCSDLGYGVARGAEMLSIMLGFGIISRLASGFVADRLGGLMTLLISSMLQMAALFLYLLSDGLTPLYIISALFGLFQGGIVPSYAIIVREYFAPQEAGTRRRHHHHGHRVRHGARRLDVGPDLRSHRVLPRRLRARHPVERAECRIAFWLLMRSSRQRLVPA